MKQTAFFFTRTRFQKHRSRFLDAVKSKRVIKLGSVLNIGTVKTTRCDTPPPLDGDTSHISCMSSRPVPLGGAVKARGQREMFDALVRACMVTLTEMKSSDRAGDVLTTTLSAYSKMGRAFFLAGLLEPNKNFFLAGLSEPNKTFSYKAHQPLFPVFSFPLFPRLI